MNAATQLRLEPLFQPGDAVQLVALERPGRVSLIRFDGSQVEFFVTWWDEGQRREAWVFADELEMPK